MKFHRRFTMLLLKQRQINHIPAERIYFKILKLRFVSGNQQRIWLQYFRLPIKVYEVLNFVEICFPNTFCQFPMF